MNTGTFLETFESARGDLARFSPNWLTSRRHEAIDRFTDLGLPTTRMELWRHTDVAPIAKHRFVAPADDAAASRIKALPGTDSHLLVFVNGRFARALSRIGKLPAGVRVSSLAAAIESDPAFVEEHLGLLVGHRDAAFSALSAALFRDGAFVHVGRGQVVDKPIEFLFLTQANGEPLLVSPRNLIVVEDEASATLIESYESHGGSPESVSLTNTVTEIHVGANASVEHYKVQLESAKAFHIASLGARQGRDSRLTTYSVSFGGEIARNDIQISLAAQGAHARLDGFYLTDGAQLVDHHTRIDHEQPNGTSFEDYRGILAGKSRAVFNGKIFVHQDAQKTDAKQNNKNLLLSRDAIVHAKPELEIYADDVKCTHGATVGQIDEEALFYLRTRGIGLAEAQGILIRAFAGDVIARIRPEGLRTRLDALLTERLSGARTVEVKSV